MRWLTVTGVLLLIFSAFLIWIKAPISGGANPSVGFGWMAGLVGSIAGLGGWYRSRKAMAICAVAGLGVCSFSVVYLGLRDPAFWSLVDENAQYASIMSFSRSKLPANYGIEPFFQVNLSTETAMDRLATAFYFVGWGWWVCLTGGSLLLIPCLKSAGRRNMRWVVVTAGMALAAQGGVLSCGFAGQYLQEQAERDLTRGDYVEAIAKYEAAQRSDPQLSLSAQLHLHLGEAYYQLGIPSHPNARFYLGDRYAQDGNVEAALPEYLLAARESSGPLQKVIHRRIAWTYVAMGLVGYSKSEIGPATGWWEVALSFDQSQLQASYFLVRAYFDQARYEQSIAIGRSLLGRSQNRLLNANVQANLGDAYWKLNDFSSARTAYEASMNLDIFANVRIFKSLGGT